MRILSIIYGNPDFYPPMIHGAEVLDRHRWQQEILSLAFFPNNFPKAELEYPDSTSVVRFKHHNQNSVASYGQFTRDVLTYRKQKPDVIIAYDMRALLPAWLLAKRHHRPLVYHCHDYVQDGTADSVSLHVFKWIEHRVAPSADLVIVPDRERAEVMVEELHLQDMPLIVANCPIHVPDRANPTLRNALRELGKQFDRIVFRQGTIGPSHGLEVTIRSMPGWANEKWGFVLIGPVTETYKIALYALATEVGVADRFVILPAVGDYRDVAKYTVGAHLGHALYEASHVNHRFITTASNKTMEYQAAALPVLLTDSSGSRSLIAKYQHGVTADVNSPEAVAAAINFVLEDDARAQEMGQHSLQAFYQEFNYENQYLPALKCFEEIAAKYGI